MKVNIIGDIHGRYEALKELLEIMPKSDKTIAIGDLIDKGTNSLDVISHFMNDKNSEVLLGNHELLYLGTRKLRHPSFPLLKLIKRVEFREIYLKSETNLKKELWNKIKNPGKREKTAKEISDYFMSLKPEVFIDNLFLSHAPLTVLCSGMESYEDHFTKMFTNSAPNRMDDKLHLFGHTEKPRIWKYDSKQDKMVPRDFESHKGKFEIGSAVGIDASPRLLIGMTIDTVTLEYQTYAVDGSNEWNELLGKKYKFNEKKLEVVRERLMKYNGDKNEN